MSRYKKLLFFNDEGQRMRLKYDDEKQVWVGRLFLPEIGTRLFANQSFYIIEEFENGSGDIIYGKPHINGSITNMVDVAWDGDKDQFKLYSVDDINEQSFIESMEEQSIAFVDSTGDGFNSSTGRVIPATNESEPVRINIAFSSKVEGAFERDLIVSDADGEIIRLTVYGEAEGEDERFNAHLTRLNQEIGEAVEFIFRNSDINEDLPNYKVLNKKRKEMILEYHNIFPYKSSLLSIIRAIRYFGYYDLRLKEYWMDGSIPEDEDPKYFFNTIKLFETNKLDEPTNIPQYPWVKTNLFGLFYDIVRETDEIDADGLPITEKAFQYSNQEILIKLFGLKKWLETTEMLGNTEIKDVIGEYPVYERHDINSWNNKSQAITVNAHIIPKFDVSPIFAYIEDLRKSVEIYGCDLPREWNGVNGVNDSFGDNFNCWVGYFDPVYMNPEEFEDSPEIPVGKLITLTNKSFELPWKDVGLTWNQALDNNLTITWETISKLNFYEMEWIVERVAEPLDTRKFRYTKRGKLDELDTHDVVLPYEGKYNVTLILYGYDNEVSIHRHEDAVELLTKNADFSCFYKIHENELQYWKSNHLKWSDIHSQWNTPIYDTERFPMSESEIRYESLRVVHYVGIDKKTDVVNAGLRDISWNDFPNNTWNDFKYTTWDIFTYPRERAAAFHIQEIKENATLQVGESEIQLPEGINIRDYKKVAKYLNDSDNTDIENFQYTARPFDTPKYIDAVAKYDDDIGDRFVGARNGIKLKTATEPQLKTWNDMTHTWNDMPLNWENTESASLAKSTANPFTMDDTKFFNNNFSVPTMVPVFFTYDNSKMAGKTAGEWTIKNDDGETLVSIKHKNLMFMFNIPGFYTVELTITDTNGNQSSTIKTNYIEVLDSATFGRKFYGKN